MVKASPITNFIINLHYKCNPDFAMSGKIDHKGIIECIDGKHVTVRIVQSSACSSCQAKAICSSSESKEKIVDVFTSDASSYRVGETVKVCASETMGRNAVVLAFVVPLVVMVVWIVVSIGYLSVDEAVSVLVAFALLAVYYFVLSRNKERIGKKFAFWIEKL